MDYTIWWIAWVALTFSNGSVPSAAVAPWRQGVLPKVRRAGAALEHIALNLSRLNHRLPGCETYPEVMQGTAEFHHEIADTLLPQADAVFDDAAALDTTVDTLDAQLTLVERLVGPLLLPGQFLALWLLSG
jgi:hypothetical protein